MNTFGIFAKYWQPGRVKTRLGNSIGLGQASEIHRLFFDFVQNRFANVADQRIVSIWPPDFQSHFVSQSNQSWKITTQVPGDLGIKMNTFFAEQFRVASNKVVLIGADCPQLKLQTVEKAFSLLDHSDFVFGPSDDGGYYLIGMNQLFEFVFSDVEWGTSTVLSTTIDIIQKQNRTVQLLDRNFDIDTEADLQKFLSLSSSDPDSTFNQSLYELQLQVRRILKHRSTDTSSVSDIELA